MTNGNTAATAVAVCFWAIRALCSLRSLCRWRQQQRLLENLAAWWRP